MGVFIENLHYSTCSQKENDPMVIRVIIVPQDYVLVVKGV